MSKQNGSKKENTRVDKVEKKDNTPLKPLNEKQKQYISAIKNNSVVLCTGVWGSAKTYIPSVLAADMLEAKQIDKIIIARPAEGKGKSIGFLKGGATEKLEPWCAPVTDTLKKRLGMSYFQYLIDIGKIEMLALEHVKGRSWDDSFIIIDEAEDLEPAVAKSLVGRQGIRSKTVITGDIAQQDIKKNSGLEVLISVSSMSKLDIPHIDFDDWEYCVRSEEAKKWGMAFEAYEKDNGKIK